MHSIRKMTKKVEKMDGIRSKRYFRKLVQERRGELCGTATLGLNGINDLWARKLQVYFLIHFVHTGRIPVVSRGKLTEDSDCMSRVPLKSMECLFISTPRAASFYPSVGDWKIGQIIHTLKLYILFVWMKEICLIQSIWISKIIQRSSSTKIPKVSKWTWDKIVI